MTATPEPPALAPGTTAQSWMVRAGWWAATVPAFGCVALLLGILSHGAIVLAAQGFLLYCVTIVPLWAVWLIVGLRRAQARERQAGYTTLAQGDLDLWRLSAQTGEVVRPPSRSTRDRR